jgi:DNA polymerase-3 subunit alpha
MAFEKAVLGFYVTNHPLRDVEAMFQTYVTLDTQSIRTAQDRSTGTLGGLITKVRMMVTKTGPRQGSKWAILLIEDLVGSIEVVLYSEQYERFADKIKADTVVIMQGTVDKSREEPSFKAQEVWPLEAAQKKLTREVLVQTSSVQMDEAMIGELQKLLASHKGSTPVKLELSDMAIEPPVRVQLHVGSVNVQNGALPALGALFGESHILALGPNRRIKRKPKPVSEEPLPEIEPELVPV